MAQTLANGPSDAAQPAQQQGYQMIPVDQLRRGEFQPREHFDKSDLLRLAQTFLEGDIGIIHPLLVRRCAGGYEIVAGERRWEAAKLAGFTSVPCIVRTLSDMQCLTIGIVENSQRSNLTCIERARAYKRAREDFNLKQEELAQMVGISRVVISNHERLLTLDPQVQAFLSHQNVTEAHARLLVGLSPKQALPLIERTAEENLSIRELARLVEPLKKEKKPKASARIDPDVERYLNRLIEFSGLEIELEMAKGKPEEGVLKIRYRDLEALGVIGKRLAGGKL